MPRACASHKKLVSITAPNMSLADWFGYLYRITIYFSRHEPSDGMTLTCAGLGFGAPAAGDIFLPERTQEVLCLQ